jgi:hypothetical protein
MPPGYIETAQNENGIPRNRDYLDVGVCPEFYIPCDHVLRKHGKAA